MKTRIIALVALILVGSALLLINERRREKADIAAVEEGWATLQEYLSAAESKDLEALKKVAYQLSPTCKDTQKRTECETLMLSAASFGREINRENIGLLGRDDKQTILVSPYYKNEEGESPSMIRTIIFLARDEERLKLLAFNPFQGTFMLRLDQATSTISTRLDDMTRDSDKDGLADMDEKCEDANGPSDCRETNPNKRDTDGDGWWDSLGRLFYPAESVSDLEERSE
jgi:hypothetical protein